LLCWFVYSDCLCDGPGVGNHEKFYNWTAFTHRYHMPTGNGGNGNFWFSYDYGNVVRLHGTLLVVVVVVVLPLLLLWAEPMRHVG